MIRKTLHTLQLSSSAKHISLKVKVKILHAHSSELEIKCTDIRVFIQFTLPLDYHNLSVEMLQCNVSNEQMA